MNLKYKPKGEDTEQILFMQWCRHHEDMYPQLRWICDIVQSDRRVLAGNCRSHEQCRHSHYSGCNRFYHRISIAVNCKRNCKAGH